MCPGTDFNAKQVRKDTLLESDTDCHRTHISTLQQIKHKISHLIPKILSSYRISSLTDLYDWYYRTTLLHICRYSYCESYSLITCILTLFLFIRMHASWRRCLNSYWWNILNAKSKTTPEIRPIGAPWFTWSKIKIRKVILNIDS